MFEVYMHTCSVNGKVYIGYTQHGTEHRFVNHCAYATKGSSFAFHKALRKHGKDAWESRVLATTETVEDARRLEIRFIAEFKASNRLYGYNMTDGGEGNSLKGRKLSPEHREKVVAVLRANPPKPEHREKAAAKRRGVPRDPSTVLAMSRGMKAARASGLTPAQEQQISQMHARNKGVPRSEETRRKIGAAVAEASKVKKQKGNFND